MFANVLSVSSEFDVFAPKPVDYDSGNYGSRI
jgi:hypothetical protein